MGKLKEIFTVFTKLGMVAFGGPAAHVALMYDELVERRKWMTAERFTNLLGITALIPGPNSTEMAMLCGYERGGIKGFMAAGAAFITPAMIITIALAFVYVRFGTLPEMAPALVGMKAGVVVIIFHAIRNLASKTLNHSLDYILLLVIIMLNLFWLDEIAAILLSGLVYVIIKSRDNFKEFRKAWMPFLFLIETSNRPDLIEVFLFFLKIGAVLFGSGYLLIAYLDTYLVDQLGWIDRSELLDAIAVGQFTPGPVLTTSTFIGYLLAGVHGGIVATLGIFLPSFVFVMVIYPLIEKVQKYPALSQFIVGAGIGALAVMLVIGLTFLQFGIHDPTFVIILVLAMIYQFGFKKANSMITIMASILIAYIIYLI